MVGTSAEQSSATMSGPPRAFSVVEPDAQPAAPLPAGFSPRSAEDEAHRKSLHDAWSAARASGEECSVVFDDRRPSSAGKVAATLVAADWVHDDFTLRMRDGAERNTVGSRIALQQLLRVVARQLALHIANVRAAERAATCHQLAHSRIHNQPHLKRAKRRTAGVRVQLQVELVRDAHRRRGRSARCIVRHVPANARR